MTMISFRVDDSDAAEIDAWASRLNVDRSELVRDALRRYLTELAADRDLEAYIQMPLTDGEIALARVADWTPVEDWGEWVDALR